MNKSILADVYCDVLIGIGDGTRLFQLSYTLRERVMNCVNSHIDTFELRTKSVDEHNKFVQESQVFCKEQM